MARGQWCYKIRGFKEIKVWQMEKIAGTSRILGKPIMNAPVTGDPPRLNAVVGATNPGLVRRIIPIFRDFGSCRLNSAKFVCASRHQHALFSIPFPVEAETGMRHSIRRCAKLGVLPTRPAVGGHFHTSDRAGAGPSQTADLVETGA